MKKQFGSILVAGVLAAGLCLGGCGKTPTPPTIKVKMECNDLGIQTISLFAADVNSTENWNPDDENAINYIPYRGALYEGWGEDKHAKTVELRESKYFGIICIRLEESHYVNGSFMNGNLELSLEVNGVEQMLIPAGYFGEYSQYSSYNYLAMIGRSFSVDPDEDLSPDDVTDEDVFFDSDLTVKLKGETHIYTYEPTVTLENYDTTNEKYSDLVFKVEKNSKVNWQLDPPLLEHNGKTEFSAAELKAAIEAENATYNDEYSVYVYFKNKDKFFPDNSHLKKFAENSSDTPKDMAFRVGEFEINSERNLTLDFSAFDDLTLDDMTKVRFADGYSASLFGSMFDAENVTYIVDGVEKTELTLAEYRTAQNVKVKTIVSEIGALILQDERMMVGTRVSSEMLDENYDTKHILLEKSDIEFGTKVDGYYPVTFDFGSYKSYEEAGRNGYLSISLEIASIVWTGENSYSLEYYFEDIFEKHLQKVTFEYDWLNGNAGEYDQLTRVFSPFDSETQIAINSDDPNFSSHVGCYYLPGGEMQLLLGWPSMGGGQNTTLELTLSRAGAPDETITLKWNSNNYWELSEAHTAASCENVHTDWYNDMSLLTLKYGDITKVSFKVTIGTDF